jgi:hypothetical protein
MIRPLGLPLGLMVMLSVIACTGCDRDFDDSVIILRVRDHPQKLEGEQVVLTDGQIECGVQMELWESPVPSGERRVARLLAAARDLKFFDDVMIEKSGRGSAQVRGDISLEVIPPFQTKDAEQGVKMVSAKVGAIIPHACFTSSLPIMGVRKGEFSADAPVQLRYTRSDDGKDWVFDRLVH